RAFFPEGALERRERGRREPEQEGVGPDLPRNDDQGREESQQDQRAKRGGPAEECADPSVRGPEKRRSERDGKQPQGPFRPGHSSPEVQNQEEERRVRGTQAGPVGVEQPRAGGDAEMFRVVWGQK